MLDLDLQELEGPDVRGHFGPYGGVYVGETLIAAVEELNSVYQTLSQSDTFWSEFHHELNHYVGRPSPLYFCRSINTALRWSKNLPKERRFKSYRCTQSK